MSPGLTTPTFLICMRVPFTTMGCGGGAADACVRMALFSPRGGAVRRRINGHLSYPIPRAAHVDELHGQPRADVAPRPRAWRVRRGGRDTDCALRSGPVGAVGLFGQGRRPRR